jgi:hypothetical protein
VTRDMSSVMRFVLDTRIRPDRPQDSITQRSAPTAALVPALARARTNLVPHPQRPVPPRERVPTTRDGRVLGRSAAQESGGSGFPGGSGALGYTQCSHEPGSSHRSETSEAVGAAVRHGVRRPETWASRAADVASGGGGVGGPTPRAEQAARRGRGEGAVQGRRGRAASREAGRGRWGGLVPDFVGGFYDEAELG